MNAPAWVVALSETTLGEEEALAAAEVVRSGWLTQGERVGAFERAFAEKVGVPHAVAVANCTVGLELAYDAAGVGPGDEVLVPALTFVATANAARRRGAIPVFVDVVSEDDLTMDPGDAAQKITKKTRAIVPVHYAGFAADMRALDAVAKGAAAVLVEDCAHSPGAMEEPAHVALRPKAGPARATGALGALGVFSFFSNKNMTTGEGGMITTLDEATAVRVRALRSHGMTTGTWDRHRGHAYTYDVVEVGTNARMDEVRAAIGKIQLGRLDGANAKRRALVRAYRARLAGNVPGLAIPFTERDLGASSNHLFVVLLPEGTDRLAVMAALRAKGIQSSIHYPPTDGFTAYASAERDALPVTHRVAGRLLTLPLYATMTEAQVDLVCDALVAALG